MLVGNDIIDLGDPESALDALHPRFAQRVFSDEERQRIARSPDPGATLWTLWAAKESAYKIEKKRDPAAIFSPRAFAVDPGACRRFPPTPGLARSRGGRAGVQPPSLTGAPLAASDGSSDPSFAPWRAAADEPPPYGLWGEVHSKDLSDKFLDGPRQGTCGAGRVRLATRVCSFRASGSGGFVHVVAWSGAGRWPEGGLLSGVHRCPAGGDPSRLARAHARTAVADRKSVV